MSKYDRLWKHVASCTEDEFVMSYADIEAAAGIPLDHSFLKYKKELAEYGWSVAKISMKESWVRFEKNLPDSPLA